MIPESAIGFRLMELLGLWVYGETFTLYSGGTFQPTVASFTCVPAGLVKIDGKELSTISPTSITTFGSNLGSAFDGTFDFSTLSAATFLEVFQQLSANVPILPSSFTALTHLAIQLTPIVTLPSLSPYVNLVNVQLDRDALNQATVDAVLVALASNGKLNGNVDVHAGTNAAPSSTGLAAAATLTGRGWSVSHN